MADAMVERRPTVRFFCHRCNIEFEDVLQDYTCPYCASGFIEQLDNDADGMALSSDDFSDADMSNIDDMSSIDEMSNLDPSEDVHHITHGTPPMLNDLAFLMSGGRLRAPGRRETLMEQLVWMIGGARPGSGAVTAGAPFVLVGAPGDYVFGGEGLDAVVTQLLGQLENAGPPPLPREQIAALPSQEVTAEQTANNASCSVCWENFQLGETVSRLECDHIFHSSCITPWLQLHATCPICRRSLLPDEPADATTPAAPGDATAPVAPASAAPADGTPPGTDPSAPAPSTPSAPLSTSSQDSLRTPATISVNTPMSFSHLVVRRAPRRLAPPSPSVSAAAHAAHSWGSPDAALQPHTQTDSSSSGGASSASTGSSVTASGVWAPLARTDSASNSTASLSSDRDRQYNMDIDFD